MAPTPSALEFEFARPGPDSLAGIINDSPEAEAANVLAVAYVDFDDSPRSIAGQIENAARSVGGTRCDAVLAALSEAAAHRDALINLVLNSATHGDGFPSIWITKPDGTYGVASELLTPILPPGKAGDKLVRVVLGVLVASGRVEVSTAVCGLHVHYGAVSSFGHLKALRRPGQSQGAALRSAAMKRAQVWLAEVYQYFQPVIDSILPRSRRGSQNQNGGSELRTADRWYYGRKGRNEATKRAFIHNPHRSAGGSGGSDGRYYKINFEALDKHGTVEFRQHQGTLSATKALMWGRVCAALWARAVNPAYSHLDCRRFSVDVGGFCSFLGLGQKTHRFLAGRARHFDFAAIAGGDYDRSRGSQLRTAAARREYARQHETEHTATSGSRGGREA